MHACVYVCMYVHHMCAVSTEARNWCQISCNCTYRWLWATDVGLSDVAMVYETTNYLGLWIGFP